jgi:hypothetical protein
MGFICTGATPTCRCDADTDCNGGSAGTCTAGGTYVLAGAPRRLLPPAARQADLHLRVVIATSRPPAPSSIEMGPIATLQWLR